MNLVRKGYLAIGFVFAILLGCCSQAQGDLISEKDEREIGIKERLGETIPLDLSFYDETGKVVQFGSLIDKPTILSLTYYSCSNLCDNISSAVAGLLGRLQSEPGKDYSVITVSFDERDTPADALQKKGDFIKEIGRPFPEKEWRFLTGNSENITRLSDSVGFKFLREGDGFRHPAALIVLSPKGRIIRYLYGTTYLPFDVLMALSEASIDRPGMGMVLWI